MRRLSTPRVFACLPRSLFALLVSFAASFSSAPAHAVESDHRHEILAKSKLNSRQKAAHVYDRLAFGGRPGEVEKLASGGDHAIVEFIESQLKPEAVSDDSTDARLAAFATLKLSSEQLFAQYPSVKDVAMKMGIDSATLDANEDQKKELRKKIGEEHLPEWIVDELRAQKLIRAIESRRQLNEVLADFWFNHFNVDHHKNDLRYLTTVYERETIRPHMFGKFIDLLRATAHSPAMLVYLDNAQSQSALNYLPAKVLPNGRTVSREPVPRKNGLNENYAREILELHTLGVDSGYSQKDVTELARILTGWTVADGRTNPRFFFNEKVHDRGEKVFLGRKFSAGRNQEEGDEALQMIAQSPKTARHLAALLARTFVSDQPPAALVDRLSERFRQTDGDLTAVYRELFYSPEFWAKESYRSKIKTPFGLVVSAVRSLGGEVDVRSKLPKLLETIGEDLYGCQPPTGYIDLAEQWVNSGAMVSRLNLALQISANSVEGVYTLLPTLHPAPSEVRATVSAAAARLLHEPISAETRSVIEHELSDRPVLISNDEVRPLSLAKVVGMILGSPEFQRH